MGFLEDLFGSSSAAQQQQQAGFCPFAYQVYQARMGEQQMPHNAAAYNPMNYPPRKHVESRVIENITGEEENK